MGDIIARGLASQAMAIFKKAIYSQNAFASCAKIGIASTHYIRGWLNGFNNSQKSVAADVLFAFDADTGQLKECQNWNDTYLTFSSNKGLPVVGMSDFRMTGFKGKVYLVAMNSGVNKIWSAPYVSGNEAFVWTLEGTTDGTALQKCIPACTENRIFIGNYGDPSSGAGIWYSTGNGTWTRCYTSAAERHTHDVQVDPYTGYIYASVGDAASNAWLIVSKDNGATWRSISAVTQYFQSVQLSFSRDYVYMALDSNLGGGTFAVVNKSTGAVGYGCTNNHKLIALPGAMPYSGGTLLTGASAATDLTEGSRYKFKIGVNSEAEVAYHKTVTLDPSVCTTGETTAAEIQSKIQALGGDYANITVAWNPITTRYTLTNSLKGINSLIRCSPSSTNEVSYLLKVTALTGATMIDGKSDSFMRYAYWGVVDPETDCYYCMTTDPVDVSEKYGLFYNAGVGKPIELLQVMPQDYPAGQQMYIKGDYLFFGTYRHRRLKTVQI